MRKSLKQRFEEKFIVTPGCWIWVFGTSDVGYGTFYIDEKHRATGSHRASYNLYVGDIPEGMHVLHRCDNRACVNPDHLFLGTNYENMLDKVNKGRCNSPLGTSHGSNKLSENQVLKIRDDARGLRAIASEYGVSKENIWKIKHRVIWSHI